MSDDNAPEIVTNIGQFVLDKTPNILVCLGLGSCVGVSLYQDAEHSAGLMHVMLPKSTNKENKDDFKSNHFKYADVGLPLLVEELKRAGCTKDKLKAKIAGGAHMFKNTITQESMDIGAKNIDAVKSTLEELKIKIIAEDVGGAIGRTMKVDTKTGDVTIKTKEGIKTI